jgi:hypothetical protein
VIFDAAVIEDCWMGAQSAVHDSRTTRTLVLIAVVLVVMGDAGYVLIVATQGSYPPDAFTVPFLAGYWLVMAVMLGLSVLDRPRLAALRPALRAGAAAGLLVTGVLVPIAWRLRWKRLRTRVGRVPLAMRGWPIDLCVGPLQQPGWRRRRQRPRILHQQLLVGLERR